VHDRPGYGSCESPYKRDVWHDSETLVSKGWGGGATWEDAVTALAGSSLQSPRNLDNCMLLSERLQHVLKTPTLA
jgi:hypothetical protein